MCKSEPARNLTMRPENPQKTAGKALSLRGLTNELFSSCRGAVVQLAFSAASIVLDFAEILSFARLRLDPRFYLVSQVIKSTMWLVFLIMDAVGYGILESRYKNEIASVQSSLAVAVVLGVVYL